jgi:hypothetical protein
MLELMDYLGVLFEASCFFMLLRGPQAWRFWLVCACSFHLLNALALNIPFFENLLAYLAFADFSRAQRLLEAKWQRAPAKLLAIVVLGSMPLLHLALRQAGRGSSFLFLVDKRRDNLIVLCVSAACWALAAVLMSGELLRWRRRAAAA